MDLLSGYLNINPTGLGGAEISIVDETALAYEGEAIFFDGDESGQISVYIVRKGDTLSSIAKMFGVSTNTIIWANDLKGGKISIGQELVILPISGVKHTVKKGDTLKSIAAKYKADLEDLLSYNGLESGVKIAVGDEIIVPDGMMAVEALLSKKAPKGFISGIKTAVGYYLRPLIGGIKSQSIHGYNGIDIAAPTGTPLMASAEGKVIVARASGYNGGYGLYVVIAHDNNTQTLYGHMSAVNVAVGQNVEQGQIIGKVGNTGRSTGPHVHFEVRGAKNPF